MTLDDVRHNATYECKVGSRLAPVFVEDVLPHGVLGKNLNTKREIFIKKEQVSRLGKEIENLSEWRLHNGD